jgi:hypothetical protein
MATQTSEHRLTEVQARAMAQLLAQHREACLWFLREDFEPVTLVQALSALGYLERYGDLQTYRNARRMRAWLSPTSNATSAAS